MAERGIESIETVVLVVLGAYTVIINVRKKEEDEKNTHSKHE